MARAYGAARELLDDIVELAGADLARTRVAGDRDEARSLSDIDLKAIALGEQIEARIAATADIERLPLVQLATTFQLTSTECRAPWLLLAIRSV